MLDTSAYLGEIIAALVYFVVGCRLYQLSRRTGQLPETLIAATFLVWTVSYALWDIPYVFYASWDLVPPAYLFGSLITTALGSVVFAFFIRAVFQPGVRWATWLVAAISVCNLTGVAGSAWIGDWEGVDALATPWYWLKWFGECAPSLWMAAEGFVHHLKARRRLKLGLCEPIICNRFLLWGIAGSLWVALDAITALNDLVYAFSGQLSALLGVGIAFFEIVPIVIVWFTFFPPAFYRRWVEGGRPTGGEGPALEN
jgi:hypothetical protein